VSAVEQQRQVEALQVLDTCLTALTADDPAKFRGLNIRLYHPDSCPFGNYAYVDQQGCFNTRSSMMQVCALKPDAILRR
jgi:hypothetical protein